MRKKLRARETEREGEERADRGRERPKRMVNRGDCDG